MWRPESTPWHLWPEKCVRAAGLHSQAIISLGKMYDTYYATTGAPAHNEPEFRAFHLLTLMGTHGRFRFNAGIFQDALKVMLLEI